MDTVTKTLFTLSHCKGISHHLLHKLLTIDPTLTNFHFHKENEWASYFNIPKEKALAIKKEFASLQVDTLLETYKQQQICFVSLYDKNYPPLLKEISDPPPILYYKGDIRLTQQPHLISVVGTRYPTNYGETALEYLLKPLIMENWIIVSGMAKGIDTIGHETAIKNGGKTIAVIAGGLFYLYPKQNIPLAKKLMESHLILSEHPPATPPQKWHFPMRNRIISGLSLGTIIIQAKKRSGSLITAYQALEQNREVFAVPGSIFDENSAGTNELIQSGAKLVHNASNIMEEFPLSLD
ncbi:DNA-processing protein DprA [uncultured Metabacillus sp.]|uniref:DNA-processing protein DprA n=1 Tax=uncultured Metabacillus sp. TaxID=2860135 RepID=UPI00261A3A4D|nr:DNA-processing protein DprA [uncultured Metabacillus sp.]